MYRQSWPAFTPQSLTAHSPSHISSYSVPWSQGTLRQISKTYWSDSLFFFSIFISIKDLSAIIQALCQIIKTVPAQVIIFVQAWLPLGPPILLIQQLDSQAIGWLIKQSLKFYFNKNAFFNLSNLCVFKVYCWICLRLDLCNFWRESICNW